jgi:hypothetical protein
MIGGIVCLVVAAGLAALSWKLPSSKLLFMVGQISIPMVVLAVAGLALLVTAKRR